MTWSRRWGLRPGMGVTPPFLMEHLRIGKTEAVNEMQSAGFRLERMVDLDLDLEQSYLAVFQRP